MHSILRFLPLFAAAGLLSLSLVQADARPTSAATRTAENTTRPDASEITDTASVVPEQELKKTAAPSRWMLTEKPVPGMLSSPFGVRPDPVKSRGKRRRQIRRHHKGVDFVANRGTLVHASGPGIVVHASRMGGYGRVVIVDHGHGLQTRYAHLQRIKTKKGEFLPAGAVLGTVGSSGRTTGPHLHFEVRQDGVALPPAQVIQFKLPDCSRHARHCRRHSEPNS